MKDLITVASFTIKDMVKRKSFIISNIIIILIIVLLFNIPNILKLLDNGEGTSSNDKLLLVDSENIFEGNLEVIKQMDLGYEVEISNEKVSFDEIKEKITNGEIDDALILNSNNGKISMEYIVENLMYVEEVPETLVNAISSIYTNMQIAKLNLTEEELKSMSPEFEFSLKQTEEEKVEGNVAVMMLLSMALFFAIYYCAYQVSTSITVEKTSKIIETLVTSTSPRSIVLGKTIGIGLVGLIQIAVYLIVALICKEVFLEPGVIDSIINFNNVTPFLIGMTLLYFLLGYAAYALLYALTGSTVSKPEDVQSANGPVAILVIIGFYLAYFTMMNPTSNLNIIASILPISSPFCMPLRIMMGIAETKDIILSIGVLLLTIIIVAKVSIRIYSNAILNYGSKIGLKDIVRMYKNKNG